MRRIIVAVVSMVALSATVGTAAHPRGRGRARVAILMPGGSGAADPRDFLIRNRQRFIGAGIRTVVASSPGEAISLSRSERARDVVIVAMSRGVIRAAHALADGAHVSREAFVSGNYRAVMKILGTPTRLPPTLVVQNRYDRCPGTTPTMVGPFRRWARGRVRVRLMSVNGPAKPKPCTGFAAHGFYGQDGREVAAILAFIR